MRGLVRLVRPAVAMKVTAVLLVVSLTACTTDRPPNVLVIVADALRADRLGCYGAGSEATPFLDELAKRSILFRNAYTAAPWTNPSIASLFTSRYPTQHGITSFRSVLNDSELTLAELLKRRGYTTAGFSAHGLYGKHTGFDQGFDTFVLRVEKNRSKVNPFALATTVNRDVASWLDNLSGPQRAKPIFLFVHYMETHEPYYSAPPEILRHFFEGELPDREKLNGLYILGRFVPISGEQLESVKRLYDAAVMHLDTGVRDLFEKLQERKFLDNALVVFTADHGQELMDHGSNGHGRTLYEEVIRVPLLMKLPVPVQGDAEEEVGLVDVAPTILDLVGADCPSTFEGHSLRGAIERAVSGAGADTAGPEGGRPAAAFSELLLRADQDPKGRPHQRAVVSGRRKLISRRDGGRELYDLASDPKESNPDALDEAQRTALQDQLAGFERRVAQGTAVQKTRDLDAETRERMRALGYDE